MSLSGLFQVICRLGSYRPLPLAALAGSLLLSGCQSLQPEAESPPAASPAAAIELPDWGLDEADAEPSHSDLWERMREGFRLQEEIGVNPRIERQRLWFVSNPSFLERASQRGSPYIHYVVERLEERNMPMELALLPVIESAYNPYAYSHAQAMGLWQFIPSTGRHFNLRQTNWYDGRRDITASTHAALNYLSRLHTMFNGDWLLALAAYNSGEGTVSRAIERNQKLGLPSDYWNLPLPKETRDYVPKLLALSQIVQAPQAYGMTLNPIANQPYFEQVASRPGLDLARVAALIDMEEQELGRLNPAFKKGITLDGPDHLLVPVDKAEQLSAGLASLPQVAPARLAEARNAGAGTGSYRVVSGDSLHSIAKRHRITVAELKRANRLSSNSLRVGQQLQLPGQQQARSSRPAAPPARHYRVRQGDTLWRIANAQGVTLRDLQRWNGLGSNSALRPGQQLRIHGGHASSRTASTAEGRRNVTYYKVKSGDSLSLIAQRFKVDVQRLQTWNPNSDSRRLRPGQTLTLYLN